MRIRSVALLLVLAAPAAFGAEAVAPAPSVQRLAWMSGCWKRTTPRRVVDEQWMAPAAGLMLGIGRTTNAAGDTLIEFEQTRIEQKDGSLVFTAMPSGQATDSFTMIAMSDSSIVFENKAHDFPQRVGYRLMPDGDMTGWIEGTRDGKSRHVDFPYRRVACPGATK